MYRRRKKTKGGKSKSFTSEHFSSTDVKKDNINTALIDTKKVYVANFGGKVNKGQLASSLRRYANVDEVVIVKKYRCGFVSVPTEEDANKLLDLNGIILDIGNQPIIIKRAKREFKLPGSVGYKRLPLSDRKFELDPPQPDIATIHTLFDELIFRIFDYLPAQKIICCEQVCRRWQVLVYQYFNDNYKTKIEKSIGSWFNENGMSLNVFSFTKTLILCGESLKSLDVLGSSFNLRNNFFRVIAQLCPLLEVLNLSDFSNFNVVGLKELSNSCTNLREFKLEESFHFNDQYLEVLLTLPQLEVLNLSDVGVTGTCFSHLPEGMKELTLVDCEISPKKFNIIPEKCPNLEVCNISGTGSSENLFNRFASCSKLRELTIDVGFCTDMKYKCFASLKVLHITGQLVLIDNLIESLPNIEELDLALLDADKQDKGLRFSSLKNLSKFRFPALDLFDDDLFSQQTLNSILECQKLETLDLGCYNRIDFILECIKNLPLLKELKCTAFVLTPSDVPKFIASNKKRNYMLTLYLKLDDDILLNNDELKGANLKIHETASFGTFSFHDDSDDFWNKYDDFEDDMSNDSDYDPFDNFYDYENVVDYDLYPQMFLEFMDFL